MTEPSAIGSLIEETRGIVGVVLGTASGELRAVVGSVRNGDSGAAAVAVLTGELAAAGKALGLGELAVASVKSASAARVLSRQAGSVVSIELEPRHPLGELETKLRTLAWAPREIDEPTVEVPAAAQRERLTGATRSPPPSVPPRRLTTQNLTRVDRPSTQGVPRSMKSVGSGPVFSGDLEEFGLPDLLELLRGSQRTGLLACMTSGGSGSVHLSRGMIVGASSPHALDLRQHLVGSPGLSLELRRTIAGLPTESFTDEALEDASALRELVPHDDLARARIARIYSAFREMVGWHVGRFSFDPAVPVITHPTLALSAQTILMQLFQEQDEPAR